MLRARRMADDDVLQCLEVDPGYTTEWVWQLERQEWGDELSFRLRPAQLPRPRTVDGYPIEPSLDDRLAQADFALLLEDQAPVAYVLAQLVGTTVQLDLLVVAPAWRRRGLGRRLLGEVRSWAQRRGGQRLAVTIEARNYPAVRFLRKQGFIIRGVRDVVSRDDEVTLELVAGIG
jgi:GNAT superfamily N-acetyltransferase